MKKFTISMIFFAMIFSENNTFSVLYFKVISNPFYDVILKTLISK